MNYCTYETSFSCKHDQDICRAQGLFKAARCATVPRYQYAQGLHWPHGCKPSKIPRDLSKMALGQGETELPQLPPFGILEAKRFWRLELPVCGGSRNINWNPTTISCQSPCTRDVLIGIFRTKWRICRICLETNTSTNTCPPDPRQNWSDVPSMLWKLPL